MYCKINAIDCKLKCIDMSKKETSSKTFRFSNDVLERLKVLSEQDNRSMNNYVSNILANHLKQLEDDKNTSNKKGSTER